MPILSPPLLSGLARNLCPTLRRHSLGPRLAALAAQRLRGLVLPIVGGKSSGPSPVAMRAILTAC